MFSQFIKAAKPVGAVVFTTAAYFMLQPAEDKTPMAFAYEKEAVGEVRRAVSMNFARLRVPLGARAKRFLDRRAVAMGFLARRLRGARRASRPLNSRGRASRAPRTVDFAGPRPRRQRQPRRQVRHVERALNSLRAARTIPERRRVDC